VPPVVVEREGLPFRPPSPREIIGPTRSFAERIKRKGLRSQEISTRDLLKEICEREGLWRGQQQEDPKARQIGVRSFHRWAEHMEDETDDMVCLLRHFDERYIRSPDRWSDAIFPELDAFFRRAVREARPYHLHLDAHASIAFAAGYCLDPKAGAEISVFQGGIAGKKLWSRSATHAQPTSNQWLIREVACSPGGRDVALALCVSHDVSSDVEHYVRGALPDVGRILIFTPTNGPGSRSVRDGSHADALAEELTLAVRRQRTHKERLGSLHLFSSAPNALLFFLGQLARGLGRCTLYEYDFVTNELGKYDPSLVLPPDSRRC
jgi:hypothetical protein